MLRYLEGAGLVVPRRSGAGYRLYGLLELNQLRSLRELRRRHDVDLRAFLEAHEEHGGVATIVVAPLRSQFGVVELAEDDRVTGFREAPRLPHWVNAGVYVLGDEALARMPERGDHEQSTFPELAQEGKLFAFRHEGLWITVNTPKDLQRAEEHYAAHPELRPTLARGRS